MAPSVTARPKRATRATQAASAASADSKPKSTASSTRATRGAAAAAAAAAVSSTPKKAAAKKNATKNTTLTQSKQTTTTKRSRTKQAGPAKKAVKRTKGGDSSEEEEQDEDEDDESDQDVSDQDDYEDEDKDEDENNDEDEDEDEEDNDDENDDDFDNIQVNTRRGRTTKKATPSQSTTKAKTTSATAATKKKSSTSKTESKGSSSKTTSSSSSTKSKVTILPSKSFLVSPLKIPHPKNGPVADAIQPETLEFIRDLKLNNDREYMMIHQERWLSAKADFMDFIRMVKEGLMETDPNVLDQEPKDAMMRIYRDVRFSNDKSPYKSQLACYFSKGGKKSIAAGYYFGLSSNGETFAGCGCWDPSGPVLHRVRLGISNEAERFKEILSTDAIRQLKGGLTGIDALQPGPSLKNGPVGFEKDDPMNEYLKLKSFAIGRRFTDEEAVSPGFLEEVLTTFDACVDFIHILNEWIG